MYLANLLALLGVLVEHSSLCAAATGVMRGRRLLRPLSALCLLPYAFCLMSALCLPLSALCCGLCLPYAFCRMSCTCATCGSDSSDARQTLAHACMPAHASCSSLRGRRGSGSSDARQTLAHACMPAHAHASCSSLRGRRLLSSRIDFQLCLCLCLCLA